MNGIDDLRRTLDQHASGLVDDAAPARSSAIRSRVAVVRRRRRAGAAAGVAAVLATVAGVSLIPTGQDGPGPATTVVGLQPPAELTSLGFTYALADGVDGEDGVVRLRLEASDEPRLVSWATSGEDDRVTVGEPQTSESPITYDTDDFGDWILVQPGYPMVVRATVAEGDPGLAVYELTDDRPEGYTKGGVTFPAEMAGGTLLGAVVGEPGENEVATPELTSTGRGLQYVAFCVGGPEDLWLKLRTGNEPGASGSGGGCSDVLPVDGRTGADSTGQASTPGEDATARLSAVEGDFDGPPVQADDLVIGVGVYALDESPLSRASAFPDVVEQDGHRWQLQSRTVSEPGSDVLEARAPGDAGAVLAVLRIDAGDVSVEVDLGGDQSVHQSFTGQRGGTTQGYLTGGETASFRWDVTDRQERDEMEVAFYVHAD